MDLSQLTTRSILLSHGFWTWGLLGIAVFALLIVVAMWRSDDRTWCVTAGLLAFEAPIVLLLGKFGLLAACFGMGLGLFIAFLPAYLIAIVLDLSGSGAPSLRDRPSIAYPVLVAGAVQSLVLGFAAGQFWFASESLGVVGLLWMIRQRWFDTLLTTRSQRLNSWIDGRFALSLSDVSQLSYVVTVPFWETAVATRMSVNWGRWAPNVVHEVSLMDAMSTAFIVAGIGVAVIAALRKADRIAVYYTVAVVAPLLVVLFALAVASAARPSTSVMVWLALTLFFASAFAVIGLLRAAVVYGPLRLASR